MIFADLGLEKPLLDAIRDKGYSAPSPIQSQTIPVILQGKDVMACAQTGTGKTAGFVLPILQMLKTKPAPSNNQALVIILAPTRELAGQIHTSILSYGKYIRMQSAVVFGGVRMNPQMMKLRRGVDILVATPGRLMDLYRQNAIRFNQVEMLVLDEADRMLDIGFINDIKKIIGLLPSKRQSLLFSATFTAKIRNLAQELLQNPCEINISPQNTTASTIKQIVYPVDKSRKPELLSHLIRHKNWYQALVFCKTKINADKLAKKLQKDKISAIAFHSDKNQSFRLRALADFKSGNVQILVATDIAARGIDIEQLPQVVNFDLPYVPQDYVHRIGRTGRAGMTGEAISFVSIDEFRQLQNIEQVVKCKIKREEVDGFAPKQKLPTSTPNRQNHSKRGGRSANAKSSATAKKGRWNEANKKKRGGGH